MLTDRIEVQEKKSIMIKEGGVCRCGGWMVGGWMGWRMDVKEGVMGGREYDQVCSLGRERCCVFFKNPLSRE